MNRYSLDRNASVDTEQAISDAFARVRPRLAAIPAEGVVQVNADIPAVTAVVLGSLEEILRLRGEAAKLPGFDIDAFDQLEEITLALLHAHTRYLGAARAKDQLPELNAEALKVRELLYSDAKNLCLRGLIDRSCLVGYTGLLGYTVVAYEVLHIAGVLADHWDTIAGRCASQRSEIDYACKLALRMVRLVGQRSQTPSTTAEAADTRARAFTLLLKTYDSVRRAIIFLRWAQGDANTIAPSLYTRSRNRKRQSSRSQLPPHKTFRKCRLPGSIPRMRHCAGIMHACWALPLLVAGCGGSDADLFQNDPVGTDAGDGAAGSGGSLPEASPDQNNTAGKDGGTDTSLESGPEASGEDAAAEADSPADVPLEGQPKLCTCLEGEGTYCAQRAQALATASKCEIPALNGHANDLLKCENNTWTVLMACLSGCKYDSTQPAQTDACDLPTCSCFLQNPSCGSEAAKTASDNNCKVPLLPAHQSDILSCKGGNWNVDKACPLGCVDVGDGGVDSCKGDSDYLLPWACGVSHTCSEGQSAGSHTGKETYAFDFSMPTGTAVHAARAGKVLRVRSPSSPGDACYTGGDKACANYCNTVEVLHDDGTVALYMHLSTIAVKKDDPVAQGGELAKSGASGWTSGFEHLHIQVQEDCGSWYCQSLPFAFVEAPNLKENQSVTSQNCP